VIDLAIAYRIYPGMSKKSAFFSTDKLKLSEMCLRSFRAALGGLQARIWVLLDGCPPEYETLFRDTFPDQKLEILRLNKIGNRPTFSLQLDLLTKQKDAQYVYFAEDDYFYLPNALEKMISFMRENEDVDFVTPYDHPDSYYTSSRFERHLVRPFAGRYWRTASSTCLTFLTSRKILTETQFLFRTFSHGNRDCPVWLALTQKLELANLRVHCSSVFRFTVWIQTFLWGHWAVFFRRRYRLWVSMPTLATHMESAFLSPLIDWQALFSEYEQSLLSNPRALACSSSQAVAPGRQRK
jgi:hypothetical protein